MRVDVLSADGADLLQSVAPPTDTKNTANFAATVELPSGCGPVRLRAILDPPVPDLSARMGLLTIGGEVVPGSGALGPKLTPDSGGACPETCAVELRPAQTAGVPPTKGHGSAEAGVWRWTVALHQPRDLSGVSGISLNFPTAMHRALLAETHTFRLRRGSTFVLNALTHPFRCVHHRWYPQGSKGHPRYLQLIQPRRCHRSPRR